MLRTLQFLLICSAAFIGAMPATAQQPLPENQLIFVHEDSGSTDPLQQVLNLWTLDVQNPAQRAALTHLKGAGTSVGTPVMSRDRRRVAFSSNVNLLGSLESLSIFILNTDDTGAHQVTGFGTLDPLPGPTGTVTGRVQADAIADAGTPTIGSCIISAPGTANTASCSPDGTFMLQNVPVGARFVKVQASVSYSGVSISPGLSFGAADVQVQAGQTTDVGTIAIRPVQTKSLEPSWSPDGNRLVVTNETTSSVVQRNTTTGLPEFHTGAVQQLAIYRLDGTLERMISLLPQFSLIGSDWSPVEDRIACAALGGSAGQAFVALINPDGSNPVGIYQVPVDFTALHFVIQCRWSPDGHRIAFLQSSLAADLSAAWSDLYVVNRDGSGLQQITRNSSGQFISSPTWSPDGQSIAFGYESKPDFLTVQRADIFTYPFGTGKFIRLTNDGRSDQPAW